MHDHHGVSREMSFLATVLTVWLLGCGGVTHYENKVDPKRDLEKDRYECTRDAQSRAYTEVAYNDPEASSKRAMLEQNEFRLCMRSRGWAEVKERKVRSGLASLLRLPPNPSP
jgi:hypothetical protein